MSRLGGARVLILLRINFTKKALKYQFISLFVI